ncbi:50S ribosomal protein L32 [Schnuerera sp. xch1]|uniref:50S ribosomal protein L32 n=1 Tax=Schnuerera sp. xch1 TaxID=2874283 RepID=UPI001CBE4284|nr:50S ribosomal protein L32 [Schnuerera sp. xch1]MBZ2173907.1 50S ribosomal protein L32 [Schnuerera sp. xch1]
MAVPKRKTSKARKNKRRASAYKLNKATITECPQCHEPKLPHRVCRACGYYRDREVLDVE